MSANLPIFVEPRKQHRDVDSFGVFCYNIHREYCIKRSLTIESAQTASHGTTCVHLPARAAARRRAGVRTDGGRVSRRPTGQQSDNSREKKAFLQYFPRIRSLYKYAWKFGPPGNIMAGTWPPPHPSIWMFCMDAGQDGDGPILPPSSPSPCTKSTNIRTK